VTLSTLGTITGSVQIEGLPFTSLSTSGYNSRAPIQWDVMTTAYVFMQGAVSNNATIVGLRALTAASTTLLVTVAQADLSNTTTLTMTMTYATST
jgi:hypothetical protein